MTTNIFITRNNYSELTKELILLAEIEGAQSTCLDIIEKLSSKFQIKIVSSIAKMNRPKLIPFFQLLAQEMAGEVQRVAFKALRKYQYLGHQIATTTPTKVKPQDVQAFISPTRLEGACILVFLIVLGHEYQAHYFSLAFNHLGIKEYFQHNSIKKEELLSVIEKQNLIKIDYNLAQRLLRDAYHQNKRYGTKVARVLSEYKHFLEDSDVENEEGVEFTKPSGLVEKELTPDRVINAYFLALKNMDAALVYDLTTKKLQKEFGPRNNFLTTWVHPFEKSTFVKSIPLNVDYMEREVRSQYQLITSDENDDLEKIQFDFYLEKVEDNWYISEVKLSKKSPVLRNDPLNPLNYQVYAVVYKIQNYNNTKNVFDNWDKVQLTGEFADGICYKWFQKGNILDFGIDVARDVYGEFILTSTELVIFSNSLRNITEIGHYLQEHLQQVNALGFHLAAKGPCLVKEVYQVITNPGFSLAKKLTNNNKLFYLDLKDYQYGDIFLKENANKSFLLGTDMEVFQLAKDEKLLEIILYQGQAFIFSYEGSLELWANAWPEIKNARELRGQLEHLDEKEKWQYYKLLSRLRKDIYTEVFVPHGSFGDITKKMQIVN